MRTLKNLLKVLEGKGKERFNIAVPRGTAIGAGLTAELSSDECVDLAIEVLEDWNNHNAANAVRALCKGHGEIKITDNKIEITFPV